MVNTEFYNSSHKQVSCWMMKASLKLWCYLDFSQYFDGLIHTSIINKKYKEAEIRNI